MKEAKIEKVEATPVLKDFFPLAQNRVSNLLQRTLVERVRDFEREINLNGDRTIDGADFRLFMRGYCDIVRPENPSDIFRKRGIQASAAMLLDCLMITATEGGLRNTVVRLPLKTYMAVRNLRDIKGTREQVRRDIKALESVSFEYQAKNKNAWLRANISSDTAGQVRNGDIVFHFDRNFFESFRIQEKRPYSYMYLPLVALQADIQKYPHSYWLCRRIAEHKRINLYTAGCNPDEISVRTLIKSCPYLPTYEDVMGSNRNLFSRIVVPFALNMMALGRALKWRFKNKDPTTYQEFIEEAVIIEWNSYPATVKPKQMGGGNVLNGGNECAKKGSTDVLGFSSSLSVGSFSKPKGTNYP